MKIGFYTFEKVHNREVGTIGSTRIRCRYLWDLWPEAEEWQIGKKYDVVIFQKVYQVEYAKMIDAVKILDLCDPDWMEGANVREMIEAVDAVTTSTEALADFVKKMTTKPVVCIPDRVKLDEMVPKKETHIGRAKKAVWFGYSQNTIYLDQTVDVLKELGLELTIISDRPYFPNKTYSYNVNNIEFKYSNLNQELIKHDIALLPRPTGIKGSYKSNNKDLIAWAIGLPVAKEPDDLDRFLDAAERNKEVKEKQELVLKDYDVRLSIEQYKQLIKEIQNVKIPAR